MSLMSRHHVTSMNDAPCEMYDFVMSHIRMRHVTCIENMHKQPATQCSTYLHASCHTHECGMSRVCRKGTKRQPHDVAPLCTRAVAHMYAAGHTHEVRTQTASSAVQWRFACVVDVLRMSCVCIAWRMRMQ